MINSCVRCGNKVKGFFKICGVCQMEVDVQKKPKVVIDREQEEGKK